jgi:hypothetical protein
LTLPGAANAPAPTLAPRARAARPRWRVTVWPVATVITSALSPGAAARRAFATLINSGALKRQPRSLPEGGWEGVSIEPQEGP